VTSRADHITLHGILDSKLCIIDILFTLPHIYFYIILSIATVHVEGGKLLHMKLDMIYFLVC
jgi:hypothetical protein